MRNSTRSRKQREQATDRYKAVASLATSPQHLKDCASASRSRSLIVYPTAVYDLDSLYPVEREQIKRQFAATVHLRDISGKTFNLMIGATRPDDSATPSERAYGCVTHSPSDGERYREKILIRTRKGRKLVQRPNKQRQIELESAYQIEQAGPEFAERATVMRYQGIDESERITIEQPITRKGIEPQPRIAVSRILESMTDSDLAADYSQSCEMQAAITRGHSLANHPHRGRPLDIERRDDAEIPSRRQIDDRSNKR